jgi:hypothetical protein
LTFGLYVITHFNETKMFWQSKLECFFPARIFNQRLAVSVRSLTYWGGIPWVGPGANVNSCQRQESPFPGIETTRKCVSEPWLFRWPLGNCNIEILRFRISISIWKDQNWNFELEFEICERNETEIINCQKWMKLDQCFI